MTQSEYLDGVVHGQFQPTVERVAVGMWVCRHYDWKINGWRSSNAMLWSQAKAFARDVRRLQLQAIKNRGGE